MYRFSFEPNRNKPAELPFAGKAPNGDTFGVNSRYFIKNGKPWYPIMGEFHFSRYACEDWEREICKMKAGGVDIVASYIFWIHHEEEEGVWNFEGNCDLRRFIELCGKHGLYVCLRVGPWAHGECRNGGLPDWLREEGFDGALGVDGDSTRSQNPRYLAAVDKYFAKIGEAASGLMLEEGGPVIAVQIENEYYRCEPTHEGRVRHMLTLKKMLIEHGLRVPFYTATGWGGAAVPEDETLPMLGGYCDAPWAGTTEELPESASFLLQPAFNDPMIGADLQNKEAKGCVYDLNKYPFLTAELGGGMQPTAHRRVVAFPKDTATLAFCKVGSGAKLLGYYVYHGGTNPIGRLSTMQESRETHYPNDLPIRSYDFDAILGEWGMPSESYGLTRRLHMFLHTWGDIVARTATHLPAWTAKWAADCSSMRLSVQHDSESGAGFIFINNYMRRRAMAEHPGFSLELSLPEATYTTPEMDIKNGETYILPYNLPLGRSRLKTTNASPLTAIGNRYFFYTDELPVYEFCGGGEDTLATLPDIVTLSVKDANCAYRFGDKLYIADCAMYEQDGAVYAEIVKDTRLTVYGATGAPEVFYLSAEDGYTADCAVREEGDGVYTLIPTYREDGETMLCIEYAGDRAELYDGDTLVSDWFTTGLPYCPSLAMLGNPAELQLRLYASEEARYYDIKPAPGLGLADVRAFLRHTVLVAE